MIFTIAGIIFIYGGIVYLAMKVLLLMNKRVDKYNEWNLSDDENKTVITTYVNKPKRVIKYIGRR